MPQLTIYLPRKTEDQARRAAKTKGQSVSRWIADQISRSLTDAWPKGVLSAAGAWPDFPELRQIRKGYGRDTVREAVE